MVKENPIKTLYTAHTRNTFTTPVTTRNMFTVQNVLTTFEGVHLYSVTVKPTILVHLNYVAQDLNLLPHILHPP